MLRLQAGASYQQTLRKILWNYLGEKKIMNPHFQNMFGLHCVTSRQLIGASRGTNLLSRNQPETSRDTRHQEISVTLYIVLKGRTEWNQSVWMGRRTAVLTLRTYACRYLKLDDRMTKPCVLIHPWAGPHHAGVVLLSWLWWHHNVQGKGEADSPRGRQVSVTWNHVCNTSKVT